MLPAGFDPYPLARAVTGLPGEGPHRRALQRDGEVDAPAFTGHRPDRDR
jgi:hypothetical protein